jgi:hypothetical protein
MPNPSHPSASESPFDRLDSQGSSRHVTRNPDGSMDVVLKAWGSFGEKPNIVSEFSYSGQQAVISVTNNGAIADVWASLRVDGPVRTAVGDAFARWSHTRDYKVRLAKGETHHLSLAALQIRTESAATARWIIDYATDKTVGTTEAIYSSVLGGSDGQAPEINLYVRLFSNPESEQGVPEFHVILYPTSAVPV